MSAEPVTIGRRTGMKVIAVQPDSPVEKAGIEPGDVIVAANGVPITGADALTAALHKSGASLTLTVRNIRTGSDVPVEVKLGGPDAANPSPLPADPSLPTGTGIPVTGLRTETAAQRQWSLRPGGARHWMTSSAPIISSSTKPRDPPMTLVRLI